MPSTDIATKGLEALGDVLNDRGFIVTVMVDGGPPCVRVVSRETSHLSENIYAAPATDGALWFWWSWAEKLAPIGDVFATADKLAAVLRVAPEAARG